MQAPGLESLPTPELLSDAEILSSIKSTMTRKQTMSLPLHLLKGNPSLDALENALRAESTLFPRAQSMRKRMVPGSQVGEMSLHVPLCSCHLEWVQSCFSSGCCYGEAISMLSSMSIFLTARGNAPAARVLLTWQSFYQRQGWDAAYPVLVIFLTRVHIILNALKEWMTPLQATLASGWDVISPEEGYLTEELQERLQSCAAAPASAPPGASRASCGQHVQLRRGELLHDVDKTVRHFYFLIEVRQISLHNQRTALITVDEPEVYPKNRPWSSPPGSTEWINLRLCKRMNWGSQLTYY